MDIVIDKHLEYQELELFLRNKFPTLNFFLLYEGLNDWDDAAVEQSIFQYSENTDLDQGLKYCLSIYVKIEPLLPLIENLAADISRHFYCSTVCDASRVVLKERNVFYSLLFENGQVFLVDDYIYEETGQVTKIIELNYRRPAINFT
ncbi:hypothetical protein Lepto7376_2965 [[Leptolyngbya] sp. PCC 7376]|uniref:hypothetical protein n=1 Tax=[Leptolyngbya] sp. PCC 7376 TaxID=111781 RepID=UPI00029F40C8|nr:hypothetical protein [[Leptolyngbya] sp. PCC 7376]AFY39211.1 hypothetical protein Lepto7376_2965 [[Leptolyngbya] sp. PCC 7376]